MFHNPLKDQAFFKIEGTTLQLDQVEGATKIQTSLYSRNVQLGLQSCVITATLRNER